MLTAGNKIDARLAERSFQHLMRLPLDFFETNQTGILVRNMQQSEGVRGFLTGALFQTLLDLLGMPMLLIGLTVFSGTLTALVLCFAGAIAAVIGLLLPIYRKQLEKLYFAESQRQAVLVETIHGIRAVKSLGLEKLRKAAWDSKVAQALRGRFTTGQFGIISTVAVTALQNVMQLTILAVGSLLIFDNKLTLGTLIAFNMLSGRVTGPLVQIVNLLNEYQQIALSVKMLRTVMDHEPERPLSQTGVRPTITGKMELNEVTFSYGGSANPALNKVSFSVEEGQMIGVVGRSGSGKTTITRLLQGIQSPQQGLIKLNGADIRNIDLEHLRRSIGVVLQDNILFRGTIRDNIAAARPDAPLEEVIEAARLAGADEFIERLPMSYETSVEESATNFSGGQRQRLAIARALLPQPRFLIFDEATSALDPESEAIVQQSLLSISKNRTTLIVSHRLSSLVTADKILVLERGSVLDYAPHPVLLERCDVYRQLWDTQTRHMS
jgi:ATP-binding cassette subfamily B protein